MASTTVFAPPHVKRIIDERVHTYLADKQVRDCPVMYVKAILSVALTITAYTWLVFWTSSVLEAEIGRAHV